MTEVMGTKTLAGGLRLDDLRALATTDEEPFLLTRVTRRPVRVLGVRVMMQVRKVGEK